MTMDGIVHGVNLLPGRERSGQVIAGGKMSDCDAVTD
jgi:hypothetical protein